MRRMLFVFAAVIATAALAVPAALASVAPGTYGPDPGSFSAANAPGSSHLASGSPSCTVNANLSIDCSAYVLGGVGHTNADVLLTANYTAIVDCFNPGDPSNRNNPIESHTTSFSPASKVTVTSAKNGQLSVPAQSVSFSGAPVGCPNPNWTPTIRPGSVTLVSFSYTLTFAGFSSAYITISEP
jgi:hypothetical protein